MVWYWVLGAILAIIYSIYKFIEGNGDYWTKQGIYTVRSGDVLPFWNRMLFLTPFHLVDLKFYQRSKADKAGKVAGQIAFRHPVLFIMDLDLIRNILVKDFDHFINRRVFDFNDETFSTMLINQVNQEWKDLRSTMSPTFSTGKIKRMFGVFNESGRKMAKFIGQQVQKSSSVEMRNVCGRYTMDVIASAAFGVDSQNFDVENSPFEVHGRELHFKFTIKLLIKFISLMLVPKLSNYIKVSFINQKSVNFLESVIRDSIRRRKELGEKRNDFLQLMLEAQNDQLAEDKDEVIDDFEKDAKLQGTEKKYEITDEVLIAQCNLFFFAGFDTTETLLIFAAYELAINPEVQERLFQELKEASENNGGELNYDTVTQLKYLDMVISETLRKYAPGVRLERKCNTDFKIPDSDLTIKKDTHVVIPIYAIHHDPELYPNPDQFDPERFTPENKAARHPYAYMPFGMGPRNCIAMRFALIEGKAAVAHLVLNFQLSPCAQTSIPMKFSRTGILKPADGMWLKVETRK